MQPKLWLKVLRPDGEMDPVAFQTWTQAMDKFWGREARPSAVSHRLKANCLDNLARWVRHAPPSANPAYIQWATANVDALMVQRAYDTAHRDVAHKFMDRLQSTNMADRYRALWQKLVKENLKEEKSHVKRRKPRKVKEPRKTNNNKRLKDRRSESE